MLINASIGCVALGLFIFAAYVAFGHFFITEIYNSDLALVQRLMPAKGTTSLQTYMAGLDQAMLTLSVYFVLSALALLLALNPLGLALSCLSFSVASLAIFFLLDRVPELVKPLRLNVIPYFTYRLSICPTRYWGIAHGLFLPLNLQATAALHMDSDLEFADLMRNGHFRADHPENFILMRLNDIVNKLRSALKQPELKAHDGVYRVMNEIDAMTSVRNQAEVDVLQAIRSRKFDQISLTIKDWGISEISTESDIPHEQVMDENGKVVLADTRDFETFTVCADGRLIRARRKIPKKYTAEDNRTQLFAGIYRGKESESGNK